MTIADGRAPTARLASRGGSRAHLRLVRAGEPFVPPPAPSPATYSLTRFWHEQIAANTALLTGLALARHPGDVALAQQVYATGLFRRLAALSRSA